MDAWIALARGPMFRVALAACLLGLAYHLINTVWMLVQSHRRSTDKELALGTVGDHKKCAAILQRSILFVNLGVKQGYGGQNYCKNQSHNPLVLHQLHQ